ncbi:hypothetical protein GCK72_000235 [Caenorhabditis remanei]|uniref:A to I editase domain-containing protein n=1 Tax=Caenorhabditis remanei TaxID=31234 RepID=A0A6A5HQ86_CAERE|nr:hypothetical protein GCK72_000235 [Caenorhabditis remanei]KAF1768423.1 hypothetical protein GCK72_000235 [Caenorhabditis remanei]
MSLASKPADLMDLDKEDDEVFLPKESTSGEIDQYAIQFYAKKCEQYHEDPKAFAAFLLNVAGNLRMISYACSPNENTDRKKLVSKKGKDQIIHKNPLVLARRGLIRYFISELKKLESGNSDVFDKNREGEIQMKMTCQLYMYSTYSYICENVYWGMEEAKGHDNNHCIMNKIRRWVSLGVQGALLSNIINPIYITKIVLGSTPNIPIFDLWVLLFGAMNFQDRECPPMEAIPRDSPNLVLTRTYVWYLGLSNLDIIGADGRLEPEGKGSTICKQEIFKAYLKLGAANKSALKYSRAKKKAGHYQYMKKLLYKKWETENNGKWLRKKSNKADKFWVELKRL